MNEDLLFEEIYQKTQDCGRHQFVKLLQQNQIKIKQLEKENKELKKISEDHRKLNGELKKENNILTEFENWLIKLNGNGEVLLPQEGLDKLQELKEDRK